MGAVMLELWTGGSDNGGFLVALSDPEGDLRCRLMTLGKSTLDCWKPEGSVRKWGHESVEAVWVMLGHKEEYGPE